MSARAQAGPPHPRRAGLRCSVLVGLLLLAACSDVAPPVPSPTPLPASPLPAAPQAAAPPPASPPPAAPQAAAPPGAPVPASRNLVLGLGEPRNPEPFTLEQRLLDAVRRNDRPTIERALERGATVHAKDDLGRSTLFLAVMDAGNLDLVRWLHGKGAALDEADVSGRTPLSFAADAGQLEIVRYLVENGAAVDRRDVQQRTPLAHATGADHPDVVAFLVDHGADVNVRDQFGDTPLIVACAKGNAATAAMLLKRGADATVKDQEGRTAKDRSAPEAGPCRSLPQ